MWNFILHPMSSPDRNLSKNTGRYVENTNKRSSYFMIHIPKFILKNCFRGAPFLNFKEFWLDNTWWHGIFIISGMPAHFKLIFPLMGRFLRNLSSLLSMRSEIKKVHFSWVGNSYQDIKRSLYHSKSYFHLNVLDELGSCCSFWINVHIFSSFFHLSIASAIQSSWML